MDVTAITVAALGLAGAISGFAAALTTRFVFRREESVAPTLQERIKDLASDLSGAAASIDAIQRDIAARQSVVEKLEQNATEYERLARLSRDEVEAVAQALRAEIGRGNRRSTVVQFLLNFAQGAFFFAAGVFVTLWLT
jgi:chromosome segregation ATPase